MNPPINRFAMTPQELTAAIAGMMRYPEPLPEGVVGLWGRKGSDPDWKLIDSTGGDDAFDFLEGQAAAALMCYDEVIVDYYPIDDASEDALNALNYLIDEARAITQQTKEAAR